MTAGVERGRGMGRGETARVDRGNGYDYRRREIVIPDRPLRANDL
jgi:hypothetical protein